MRSSLFILLCLLLASACNTTERVVHFPTGPSTGAQVSAESINALQTKYGAVDGVYLNYDETLEHNVSIAFTSTIPHWKFYHIVDRSYVVYNPSSPELSAFRLEVGPKDNLEQASITVQVPGSSGITYDQDDLVIQNGADGQKIYSLSYSIAQPGTLVHERFEVTKGDLEKNPPIAHDIPLQHAIPAERINFQYVYPIWWQVDVKQLSLNQPLDYRRVEDPERRKIILTYTAENTPAFVEGVNGTYFKQSAPYFQLQVTNLSMGSALRYEAPEDWTEYAEDYRHYAVSRNSRRARSIQRTTENLIGPASSNLDRVEVLLNYLKDNIIVSDDIKQRSFDMALSRREANPYRVTGLMQSMLFAAGIDSEFLLVHPAYEGYFDSEFFSDAQLGIPALAVFVDGEQYYVLPGRQRSISEGLPAYLGGQTAMVITNEGFGGFTEVFGTSAGGDAMIAGNTTSTNTQVGSGGNGITPVSNTPTNPVQEIVPQPSNTTVQPPSNTTTNTSATSGNGITTPSQGGGPAANGGQGITNPTNVLPQGNAPAGSNPDPMPVEPDPGYAEPVANALDWEGSIVTQEGGFAWVVASRTTIEEANELANQYAALYRAGISVDVLRGESRGVVRYRIAIGQYSTRSLAEEDRSTRLRTVLPSDAWLLRLEASM